MRRLKSWSVPPSSTSARTSTESVALEQRVEELHQRDRRRRSRSAWRSRRARASGRRSTCDVRRRTSSMSSGASHSELRRISSRLGRHVEDARRPARRRSAACASTSSLREPRAGRRLARRVADLRGEVADDQHRDVAEVLEQAQPAQHDREAEVDVGGGRVDARASPAAGGPRSSFVRSSASEMTSTAPAVSSSSWRSTFMAPSAPSERPSASGPSLHPHPTMAPSAHVRAAFRQAGASLHPHPVHDERR